MSSIALNTTCLAAYMHNARETRSVPGKWAGKDVQLSVLEGGRVEPTRIEHQSLMEGAQRPVLFRRGIRGDEAIKV